MRTLLALAAVLTTVACTPIPPLPGQTATPSAADPSASAPSAAPSEETSSTPTSPITTATASRPPTPTPARPTGPQDLTLSYGQTARLAYFDVTALRQEHGQDGISIGWKVRVCYRAPHPGAGSDGRTRVSNNPWSVEFRDGETGGPTQWRAIQELPPDTGWVPEYTETHLALGECHEGWMAVRHENPDLQWTGLRYAPADFGDTVVWR